MLSTRFGRAAFSCEDIDGRREDGREPDGVDDVCGSAVGAPVDSAGFTSAGDEYDRLSNQGAGEAPPLPGVGTNDLWDHV